MAEQVDEPEGHCRCCSKRVPPHRKAVRWLGPVLYVIYKIAWDHWSL
ncbi:hypothetical protein [Streptomyces sp. Ru73]|nr:hypothetical protein [Streptomyces sp. Ru73]